MRKVLLFALVSAMLTAIVGCAGAFHVSRGFRIIPGWSSVLRMWPSPDGRHRLVLYRHPTLNAMPGGGSDAPGTLILEDADGRILRSAELEMVQLMEEPEWSEDRVYVTLIADWPLD